MFEEMRLVTIIGVLLIAVAFFLGLGYWRVVPRRVSLALSIVGIAAATGAFLMAVLPNNQFYGPTVATLPVQQEKIVALTFDDGPNPPYTEKILAVLAEEQVHATFFVLGEHARRYPEWVRREIEAGHEVGTHSDLHKDVIRMDRGELAADLAQAVSAIETATGRRPQYFRPPHGFRDPLVLAEAQRQGLTVVNWTVMSRDWTNPGVDVLVERMQKAVEPGSIILLHDGDGLKQLSPRDQTAEAARIIIRRLKAEGYRFVTLSEALEKQK